MDEPPNSRPRGWSVRRKAMPIAIILFGAWLAPASAQRTETQEPAPSLYFQALWQNREFAGAGGSRPVVVLQVTGEPDSATGRQPGLPVRIVAVLSHKDEKFQPHETKLLAFTQASEDAPIKPGEAYWIAQTYEVQRGRAGQPEIRLQPFVFPDANLSRRYRQTTLLPIDSPDGPLAQAIRELIYAQPAEQRKDDRLTQMLHYLASDNAEARDLAACFASVNGMGLSAADADAERRELYARTLLDSSERTIRRPLAMAYSNTTDDILPAGRPLLAGLINHADGSVFGPVLRDGLALAAARAEELVPLVRPLLSAPKAEGADAETETSRRRCLLRGLQGWGRAVLPLAEELEGLARGRVRPDGPDAPVSRDQRLAALILLLDADAPGADALLLDTFAEIPSAAGMQYAVRRRLNGIVPAVIEAARSRRLTLNAHHLAALALLTERFPGGRFEQYDRWWGEVEQAGLSKAMLETDFVDPALEVEGRQLVARLASPVFSQRVAARSRLAELSNPLPPSVRKAQDSSDPEVARSTREIIVAATQKLEPLRQNLDAAAQAERQTGGMSDRYTIPDGGRPPRVIINGIMLNGQAPVRIGAVETGW